jgi:hypothetical protein
VPIDSAGQEIHAAPFQTRPRCPSVAPPSQAGAVKLLRSSSHCEVVSLHFIRLQSGVAPRFEGGEAAVSLEFHNPVMRIP